MHEPTAPVRQRTAAAAHASRTAAFAQAHGRGLVIAVIVAGLLALSGAFGSGGASLPLRFAYWLSTMLIGAAVGGWIAARVRRRGWLEDRLWLQGAVVVMLITLPLTVLVWGFTSMFFEARPAPSELVWFFVPVLTVTVVMTALNYMTAQTPVATHAAAAGAPPPRFLDRLPFKLRGAELHAVEAEDHYLRVHTDRGSDLVLMRLSDAVGELEGLEGAQTHRSWWVARAAVEDARRSDGRAVLRLKGGVEAPVSRTYAKALRGAGWF